MTNFIGRLVLASKTVRLSKMLQDDLDLIIDISQWNVHLVRFIQEIVI